MTKKITTLFFTAAVIFLFSCKNSTPESDWNKVQLGTMGITVEAPFSFQEKDMAALLTPSVKKKIKKMETFTNEEKGNYYAINIAEYAYDVTFSSTAAVNGAISEMRMKAGGEISNRKDETKQINGNEAAIVNATLTDRKKDKMEIQMAILNKGNIMYQVICMYKNKGDDAKKAATRIIESIIIN